MATLDQLRIPDVDTITKWLLEFNNLQKSDHYNAEYNHAEATLAIAAEQMQMACSMSLLAIYINKAKQ
jgi:hypothetical protein